MVLSILISQPHRFAEEALGSDSGIYDCTSAMHLDKSLSFTRS